MKSSFSMLMPLEHGLIIATSIFGLPLNAFGKRALYIYIYMKSTQLKKKIYIYIYIYIKIVPVKYLTRQAGLVRSGPCPEEQWPALRHS